MDAALAVGAVALGDDPLDLFQRVGPAQLLGVGTRLGEGAAGDLARRRGGVVVDHQPGLQSVAAGLVVGLLDRLAGQAGGAGTVEVRGMDVQPRPEQNAAVAALIQALAAKEIDRPGAPGLTREAIEESYYQAGRYGLQARLMVDDHTAAPALDVARATLEEARPYAEQLGGADPLEEIERIVAEGNGADRQRRVVAESGMEALLADLYEQTRI